MGLDCVEWPAFAIPRKIAGLVCPTRPVQPLESTLLHPNNETRLETT